MTDRTTTDKERASNHADQILQLLAAGPRTNRELAEVSLKYTGRVSDLRARGHDIQATRIEGGLYRYTLMQPYAIGQPANPLTPTQGGIGMALVAIIQEVFTGQRQRLLWCTDLKRDVGEDADSPIDPTDPDNVTTKWGSILLRFRDALDRQPNVAQKCRIAMMVRYRLKSSGTLVQCTFDLPWNVHLTFLCGWEPRVGVWRIWAQPPHVDSRDLEGDQLPDMFWYDGIPF